jgi:hypothetical protein
MHPLVKERGANRSVFSSRLVNPRLIGVVAIRRKQLLKPVALSNEKVIFIALPRHVGLWPWNIGRPFHQSTDEPRSDPSVAVRQGVRAEN